MTATYAVGTILGRTSQTGRLRCSSRAAGSWDCSRIVAQSWNATQGEHESRVSTIRYQ
jgi:hypothetical protein